MDFLSIKFTNPLKSNLCYSNASVNGLMASQNLMSRVDPNHDQMKRSCEICRQFSYLTRVGQLQPHICHSTDPFRNVIGQFANEFLGRRQQDPAEFIGQILNNCSNFKKVTSHQSLQTYTCLNCNTKSNVPDDRTFFSNL